MRVIDEAAASWFLLENEGGRLLLDVHCSQSFFDYSVLIELDAEERQRLHEKGRTYLDWLSHEIHYGAPAIKDSRSPYKARNLTAEHGRRVMEAVQAWRAKPAG